MIEVMKRSATQFEDAARSALRIESALWWSEGSSQSYSSFNVSVHSDPSPIKIGNTEDKGENISRERLLSENRCYKCHKVGCRPWKHAPSRSVINNYIGERNIYSVRESCKSDQEN